MRFCEECGAQLDDNTTFCEECGAQVAPLTTQIVENEAVPVEQEKVTSVASDTTKTIGASGLANKTKYIFIGIILLLVVVIVILVVVLITKPNQDEKKDSSSTAQTTSSVEDKTSSEKESTTETETTTEEETTTEVETTTEAVNLVAYYGDLENTGWYSEFHVSHEYVISFKSINTEKNSIIFDLYMWDTINFEMDGMIPGIEGKLTESGIEFNISPEDGLAIYAYNNYTIDWVETSFLKSGSGTLTYDGNEVCISKIVLDAFFSIDTTDIKLDRIGMKLDPEDEALNTFKNTQWDSVTLSSSNYPKYVFVFRDLSTGVDSSGEYACVIFDLYLCMDTALGVENLWISNIKGKMEGDKLIFSVGTQYDDDCMYVCNDYTGYYVECQTTPHGYGSLEISGDKLYLDIDISGYVDINDSNLDMVKTN